MAVRTFDSPDGTTWTAWEVIPGRVSEYRPAVGSHLPRQMADGWLCFDCGSEKRRLFPLPPNWSGRTDAELWFLCRAAEPVRARNGGVRETAPASSADLALEAVGADEAEGEPAGV